MITQSSLHSQVKDALTAAGVHAVWGPADDLPTEGGLVAQAAILWPAAGVHERTRADGSSTRRSDSVRITCVGATALDALAVAEKVEGAIGGRRFSAAGGPLVQVASSGDPIAEPNTDPRRVSLAVQYVVVTKG